MDEMDAVLIKQISAIEQRDEAQIMAELAGEQLEEMTYTVEVWDRKSRQTVKKARLSWGGTKEVARHRGNIMLSEPIVTDLEDTIRIMVKATDLERNFTVFGGCQQPRKMKVNDYAKDGSGEILSTHLEEDAFAFQKGLSKCQRNALTLCIPADYAAKCITRFLKASGTKLISQDTRSRKAAAPKIKPRAEWDKITPDMVPDFPHLEPLIWNLCKVQPAEMYRELGVGSRNDMTIPAWDAYLTLKQRFVPDEITEPEPPIED